jgi:hypothetical protein
MHLFNRTPFNRLSMLEAYFNVAIASATVVNTRLSIEIPIVVAYESTVQARAAMTRDISVSTAITTATELFTAYINEYTLPGIKVETASQFTVYVTCSRVDRLVMNGNFAPGDRIVIDTKARTVTLNGVNVLDRLAGDFISLVAGDNVITYEDQEQSRTILTRITHRDQYLY